MSFASLQATDAASLSASQGRPRSTRIHSRMRTILPAAVVVLSMLIAIARIIQADETVPQGFDEPCHIAAGMKWLDKHDYTLDPLHPPLSRDAIALPLYLSGERFPVFHAQDTIINGYCAELGNAILYGGNHYWRNLLLARLGILPFFCLATVLVYLWASREFGTLAGCLAAVLFSTLPGILAFSSLAYTDLPTAAMQFLCLFAFVLWLQNPSLGRTLLLGASAGLAFSTKLTSFLYLSFACTGMLLVWHWFSINRLKNLKVREVARLFGAACLGLVLLWGSYSFSLGHIQNALDLSPSSVPSFHALPGPMANLARRLVLANPVIPAPDLLHGITLLLQKNKQAPFSYLLGQDKPGGWWYFFPAALALKTPLPFLILASVGLLFVVRVARAGHISALMPTVAIAAIFLATMFVSLRVGTRHVLVLLPLLAVLAGYGAARLWRLAVNQLVWARVAVSLLLVWQLVSSARAQSDLIAYFNELAPSDPSEALIKGCDLDCGQDLWRLSRELRSLHANHVSIGVWSSSELSRLDLPPFDILQPHKPVTGWVAVSVRALRTGQVVVCRDGHIFPDYPYPRDTLSWIESYQPVAHIGRTILLYNIPQTSVQTAQHTDP